jgi:hypothetical protein
MIKFKLMIALAISMNKFKAINFSETADRKESEEISIRSIENINLIKEKIEKYNNHLINIKKKIFYL